MFFGWVLFRFENLKEVGAVLAGLFGAGTASFGGLTTRTLFVGNMFFLIFCVIACTPLGKWIKHRLFLLAKRNMPMF